MRILTIGGSGLVGQLIVPPWSARHRVRVLDPQPFPGAADVEHIVGTAHDLTTLRGALQDIDVLVYLPMGPKDSRTIESAAAHFEISVVDLYASLVAAHDAGVRRAVYASSLSVFANERQVRDADALVPNSNGAYGLGKRLGEEVCKAVATDRHMGVIALRLVWPRERGEWLEISDDWLATIATEGGDVASAFDAAVTRTAELDGFETYLISGDADHRFLDMTRTARDLGWVPVARRFCNT